MLSRQTFRTCLYLIMFAPRSACGNQVHAVALSTRAHTKRHHESQKACVRVRHEQAGRAHRHGIMEQTALQAAQRVHRDMLLCASMRPGQKTIWEGA